MTSPDRACRSITKFSGVRWRNKISLSVSMGVLSVKYCCSVRVVCILKNIIHFYAWFKTQKIPKKTTKTIARLVYNTE